jgi:hypothetical protein
LLGEVIDAGTTGKLGMTPSRVFQLMRTAGGRVATIAAVVVVLAVAIVPPAFADSFEDLVQQLRNDSSEKVRLSAALNLARLGNPRAIPALVASMLQDNDRNVRGAAAVGLGRLVTDKTPGKVRRDATEALSQVLGDPNESDFVKSQAEKSLKAIGGASAPTPSPGGGSIYVNIGPMSSKTGGDDERLRMLMAKVATKTMARAGSRMTTSWPGSATPSKAMLDAKSALGFYVDGTLNELKVKESGSSATVSCKISMLLASYPDKSIFGMLNGGASVQASSSARDVGLAREDCVSAVIEDLIAKKIVPTINTKAGAQ